MAEATVAYRVEATPKPSASHWEHMREVGDHLQRELDLMSDLLALSRGELSSAGAERLGLDPDYLDSGYDPYEEAMQELNSWALEIQVARWEGDSTEREIARVYVVLGTGGPHVELDISYATTGRCESVELRRFWTETDSARTTDTRATELVDDFVRAFVVPE
jgi:hypothetical protein